MEMVKKFGIVRKARSLEGKGIASVIEPEA